MCQGHLRILVSSHGHPEQGVSTVLQQAYEAQLRITGGSLMGAGYAESLSIGGLVRHFKGGAIQTDQAQCVTFIGPRSLMTGMP